MQPGYGPLVPALSEQQRPLRQQVLERVRAAGAISRIDIAKQLMISPASVTSLSADLIGANLLREIEQARGSGRGRPPVALGMNPAAHHVAGIKISDQDHTGVIIDFAGQTLVSHTLRRPAPFADQQELMALVSDMLDALCQFAELERYDLSAVGIGLPGYVEHDTGRVTWSPILREADFNLAEIGARTLGLPTVIENDANLVTLAELWFGKGRAKSDFAVITIEHGVGMGLVHNHRLFRGARGLGTELGHIKVEMDGALCRCGQRGCLEAYVSDYAIAREAGTALGIPNDRRTNDQAGSDNGVLDVLFERAKAGDERARGLFNRAGRYLAMGMANVVNLFDPDLIILAGARLQYDLIWADDVMVGMQNLMIANGRTPPMIEVHAGGNLIWAKGAAALAIDYISDVAIDHNREFAAQ